MKNGKIINILLVLVIVMTGFNIVRADDLKISFDEEKMVNFSKVIEDVNVSVEDVHPVVVSKNKDFVDIDYLIMHTIKWCEENKMDDNITDGLRKLLVYGTSEEKRDYLFSIKYTLPKRFFGLKTPNIGLYLITHINKIGAGMCEQVCSRWEMKTVCRDKEIWQTACIFGTVVCYAAAGANCGPAGAVCTLVNRVVSECIDVPVCLETYEICSPGF